MSRRELTAISGGDSKVAALYFDNIVPAGLPVDLLSYFKDNGIRLSQNSGELGDIFRDYINSMREFFPEKLRKGYDFAELLMIASALIDTMSDEEAKQWVRRYKYPENLKNVPKIVQVNSKKIAIRFQSLLTKIGVEDAVLTGCAPLLNSVNVDDGNALVTLCGLELIDVKNASLEQISELRKDKKSQEKLRNLRLYVYQNYAGKSTTYIKDDLYHKIDEYNDVAKKWSFDTTAGAISMLFNSKLIIGGGGISFLTALLGHPVAAAAPLTAGMAVELGKIGVEISKAKFEATRILGNHPASFIVDTRKKLK